MQSKANARPSANTEMRRVREKSDECMLVEENGETAEDRVTEDSVKIRLGTQFYAHPFSQLVPAWRPAKRLLPAWVAHKFFDAMCLRHA